MTKHRKTVSLDIVLPHRIGDCLLTIPAIMCLKELNQKHNQNQIKIRLVCGETMFPLIKKLDIAESVKLTYGLKLKSWILPKDKAFFYLMSSKTIGFKYLNFDVDIPYLIEIDTRLFPDEKLLEHLKKKYDLSNVAINNFALCLSLGYTSEQIQQVLPTVFKELSYKQTKTKNNYLVCCMEAGYGKKRVANRRWKSEDFLLLSEFIYSEYKLSTVFIGMDKEPCIPSKPYLIDCREKSSIGKLEGTIKNSAGYYGNDTGPLHLANFLNKPTCGIYTTVTPEAYGPILSNNNYPICNPKSIDEVKHTIKQMIEARIIIGEVIV